MHIEYLNKLVDGLKNASFYEADKKLAGYEEGIEKLVMLFSEVKKNGNVAYFIGNGGSAAIASHMTTDFKKNGNMKTGALLDASVLTCFGNDFGYDKVFSKQLEQLGNSGDLLVATSSSGNSMNIVNAIEVAKQKNMKVITLSGFKPDNKIVSMGDINVHVAVSEYGIVETAHIAILQQVVDAILERDGAFK